MFRPRPPSPRRNAWAFACVASIASTTCAIACSHSVSTDAAIQGGLDAGSAIDAGATPDAGGGDAGTIAPDAGGLIVYGCGDTDYGTVGATFSGVPAYCQPSSGDGYYQCDELANRWVRDALQHPNIENVATDYANTICAKAVAIGTSWYSVYGPGFTDPHQHAPVPGDLIVWDTNPPWTGHTAVVTAVSSVTVSFLQQNDGPPVGDVGWDASASYFADSMTKCWIHAEPNTPAAPPSGPDCGCFAGNGNYCGLSLVDHAHWFNCTIGLNGGAIANDTLYSCESGVFQEQAVCDHGCVVSSLSSPTGSCAP